MAHFWRLIALVLVLFGPVASFAQTAQPDTNCLATGSAVGASRTTSTFAYQIILGTEDPPIGWNHIAWCTQKPPFQATNGIFPRHVAKRLCPAGTTTIGSSDWKTCIPLDCPAGFYEVENACVPTPDCGGGHYWNGSSCQPIPDPPLCNPPKVIIGDQCMLPPDPDDPCPPPNALVNGQCVPPCPGGLSRIDGVCKCPEGKVYIDGQCKDPECNHPLGTPLGGEGQYTSASYDGGLFCHSQCVVYPTFSGRDPISGQWFANGPLTSTGVACTGIGDGPTGGGPEDPSYPGGGDPPPPEEPPKSCSKGRCPGTVNGVTVCVPCSDTSSSSSGSSSPGGTIPGNGADGTGGPGQPGGLPGSSSTSTSTTCKDGKCTTTTTTNTTGEDGQAVDTKTETKEETKEDFCTENPKSPHCVDGSFGGSCEGGFTCEGDAVQCAIAQQQHLRMCKLFDDHSSAEAQLYESLKGKEGNVTGDLEGNATFDLGPASIDTSSTIGASCIQDMNVTVMGSSITIKLSSVCQYLEMLGNVLMALSFLLGARIVIRG